MTTKAGFLSKRYYNKMSNQALPLISIQNLSEELVKVEHYSPSSLYTKTSSNLERFVVNHALLGQEPYLPNLKILFIISKLQTFHS